MAKEPKSIDYLPTDWRTENKHGGNHRIITELSPCDIEEQGDAK
tara:strand:- start:2368 stop:2499 length:132 start_codon:yes stop_codon:yes gene_type:complete